MNRRIVLAGSPAEQRRPCTLRRATRCRLTIRLRSATEEKSHDHERTDPRAPLATPLLVCHSHLRWDWVYQRPQHLLSRLARHWPVIVEEEPVFDDRPPGLDVLPVAEGVTVLRPHRRPDQDFDLGRLVEDYVGDGPRATGRWSAGSTRRCSPPTATGSGPDQVVVYDCMDELANFAGAPAGLVEAEARLLERADVVFTGGRSLYESKRDRNPNVHCFPSCRRAGPLRPALDPRPAAARRPGRACRGRSSAITAWSTSGSITT